MAPLTWQQVAGADFRGTNQALALGNEALNRAFTGIGDALGRFDTYSKDVRLSNILNQTTGLTDPTQLRAAIAGADRSGLGAAQFAALENMLSGRIKQAGDLEQLDFDQKNNPLRLTNQANINRGQDQTFAHNELYLPLVRQKTSAEIGQIGAQTASTVESTRGARARNNEFIETSPYRVADARTSAAARASDYDEQQNTRLGARLAASVLETTNSPTDAEAVVADMRAKGQITDAQVPYVINGLRAQLGAYQPAGTGAPGAPAASGGGRAGRGASAEPAPTVLGPLPIIPGQEREDGSIDVNRGQAATAALAQAVSQNLGRVDAKTGALTLTAAMADTTPKQEVISKAFGKGTTFEKVDPRYVDAAITDIMRTAEAKGVDLTPKAAADLYARHHTFSNDVLANDRSSWFSWDPSNNRPTYNSSGLEADLDRMKKPDFVEAARAGIRTQSAFKQVQTAQDTWTRAGMAYQEALATARNRGKVENNPILERRRAEAEKARIRFDETREKFLQDHPEYASSQRIDGLSSGRIQPGTIVAPVDESSVRPPVQARPTAPAAAALARAVTPPASQYTQSQQSAADQQAAIRARQAARPVQEPRQVELTGVERTRRLEAARRELRIDYPPGASIPDNDLQDVARKYGLSLEDLKGSFGAR